MYKEGKTGEAAGETWRLLVGERERLSGNRFGESENVPCASSRAFPWVFLRPSKFHGVLWLKVKNLPNS